MLLKVKITDINGQKKTVFMNAENTKSMIEILGRDDNSVPIKSIKVSRNEKFHYMEGYHFVVKDEPEGDKEQ